MKTRVFMLALMVVVTSFANAQEKKEETPQPDKKIEAKVKRMTERFMLDDATEAKFVPLYQAYLEEKAACRPEFVSGEELTDAQLKANMEAMIAVREKALDIDKKYYKKLSKLLNAKQLDMIFGFKPQAGKRNMLPGKDGKKMPPVKFGKPGGLDGKCQMPRDFKKGEGCRKTAECKKCGECKKDGTCKTADACKKDGECKKADACKKNEECKTDDADKK